jgi:7,8-dihydropterin-6-yl-methyl-4-(beta-D-ribofuranosyl)aminobenzene 5'-phosphate synthase
VPRVYQALDKVCPRFLKKFDLEFVFPMHCSGQNFIDLAKQEIPEKLVLCGTGSSFTFTA